MGRTLSSCVLYRRTLVLCCVVLSSNRWLLGRSCREVSFGVPFWTILDASLSACDHVWSAALLPKNHQHIEFSSSFWGGGEGRKKKKRTAAATGTQERGVVHRGGSGCLLSSGPTVDGWVSFALGRRGPDASHHHHHDHHHHHHHHASRPLRQKTRGHTMAKSAQRQRATGREGEIDGERCAAARKQ